MLNEIKLWLLKPFPLPTKNKSKFKISFWFGFFVFIFLLVFKPFDLYSLNNDDLLYYSFIYGVSTTSVILLNFIVFTKIFKSFFNPNNWTIYKLIIIIIEINIIVNTINWISSSYSSFYIKGGYSFLYFLVAGFLVSIFPILAYIYFIEKSINSKKQKIAGNISKTKKSINNNIIHNDNIILKIYGNNKNEEISINLKDFLYINSEKNYASIYYLKNKNIKEALLRISLNNIEKQLANHVSIVRCHKSYIVNTKQVIKIEGNARGYLLKIKNVYKLVPVSRNFPKELLFTLINY